MTVVADRTTSDLVGAAIEGDRSAWDALVERYTRLVWHVVLGFHQLDAETQADVHQTTWLKLAEQLEKIRDPETIGGWLATTAKRECIRMLKVRERETPSEIIELEPDDAELDRHMLESERDAQLWVAFRELDESCQRLLRLLLADPPFSYDEIAALLDMKRGSIGPTRGRCLDALRVQLERLVGGAT